MKILFITNIPSPYRVSFFNELGEKSNLTVLYERKVASDRDINWKNNNERKFKEIYLKTKPIGIDSSIGFSIIKHIKNTKYDVIIISGYSSPTVMIAIQYMKIKKIAYCIESDGGFPKNGRGIKEKIKKHFITGADGYFSTATMHDNYYLAYGAEKDKIYRYPFTSLKEKDILDKIVSTDEKKQIKETLGIQENKVVLSVGRFIPLKRIDVLIRAAKEFDKNTGVYIIGGQPTEEYLSIIKELDIRNIHFIDFMSTTDLKNYYKASDIFVFTTSGDVWGLVVNEAMACGLPVVSTDKAIASLELIKNNENGYIVPVGDEKLFAEKINTILHDNELCKKMSKSSLEKIKPYTIENMVDRHIQIFNHLLKSN